MTSDDNLLAHCGAFLSFGMATIFGSYLWTLSGLFWLCVIVAMARRTNSLAAKYNLPSTVAYYLTRNYLASEPWLDEQLECMKNDVEKEEKSPMDKHAQLLQMIKLNLMV